MKSIISRRQTLASAAAFALPSFGSTSADSVPTAVEILPHSLTCSFTIRRFVEAQRCGPRSMPIALDMALNVEPEEQGPSVWEIHDDTILHLEERRAEFFSWFAIRTIAPRHLRRAGFHAEADTCEWQTIPWRGEIAAKAAVRSVGRHAHRNGMSPLSEIAYKATSFAWYTVRDDTRIADLDMRRGVARNRMWISNSAWHCGLALTTPFARDLEDVDACEAAWIWTTAVQLINAAAMITRGNAV